MKLESIFDLRNCSECPFEGKAKVKGEGPKNAEVLICGQNPGYYEVVMKRPFVGKSGQKLNEILAKVGIDRHRIYLTNALLCRGEDDTELPSAALNCCKQRLLHEIAQVKPKLIICLGLVAAKALLGVRTLQKTRGRIFNLNGAKVFVTHHPAKILRNWELAAVLESDLRRAISIVDLKTVKSLVGGVQPNKPCYQTLSSVKEVQQLCEYLAAQNVFSVDTETGGYDFLADRILCCQFSCKESEAYCVPLLGYQESEVWSREEKKQVILSLKALLASKVAKVFANAKFDLKFLHRLGIFESDTIIWDVILMHHLLNENIPHALDELMMECCDAQYTSDHLFISDEVRTFAPKDTDSFADVPPDLLYYYGCGDADGSLRVFNELVPRLRAEKLMHFYIRLVYPLLLATMHMEERGVVIDKKRLGRVASILEKQVNEQEGRLFKLAGKEFNPRSTKQVGVLFAKFGLQSNKITKKGNVSFDKTVLEGLQYHHDFPKDLLKLRKVQKLKSTYLDGRAGDKGILRRIKPDGRLHPNFLVHGTRSGRLSSSKPNFQNIPGEPPEIRQIFTVKKGWKFISADYEKAELNVIARLAGDQILIARLKADYEKGEDFHTATAWSVGLCKKDKKPTDRQRFNAKMVAFASIYRSSALSLALRLGLPERRVQAHMDKFAEDYAKVEEFASHQKEMAFQDNFVLINVFGRRRRFYGLASASREVQSKARRQAVNNPVQSGSSEILSLATGRIDKRIGGMQTGLIGTLHDGLFAEAPDDEVEEACAIIKEEMERYIVELDYYPKVSIKVSDRWNGENFLKKVKK